MGFKGDRRGVEDQGVSNLEGFDFQVVKKVFWYRYFREISLMAPISIIMIKIS